MKTIPKDQIESTLGKNGFAWFPKKISLLRYIQGIPELDALQESQPAIGKRELEITALPHGFEFSAKHNSKSIVVGISYTDVKQAAVENPEDIVTKKDRSVIGRAVVGGLLLGPVGAIVGGMSGLQEGKKVESTDIIITLRVEQDAQEYFIVATVAKKYKILIDKFFIRVLPPLAPSIEIVIT